MEIGSVFGRLKTVSSCYKIDSTYNWYVDCECQCGSPIKRYRKASLTQQKRPTLSCGCVQRESAKGPKNDLTGKVFSRLTVTKELGKESSKTWVLCSCSCGVLNVKVRKDQVQSGNTKSCGCLYKEDRGTYSYRHGMSGTPTYFSWQSMKERCRNPNVPGYENYGGRGITYDPRWEDFVAFYEDMGERPEGLELDRIDVNGNYCKENCQWSDATAQSFNRRKMQGTSSEYVGVSYDKERNCWQARLNKHGVVVFRGRFATQEAAAQAYDAACQEHYGVTRNFSDKEINNVSS